MDLFDRIAVFVEDTVCELRRPYVQYGVNGDFVDLVEQFAECGNVAGVVVGESERGQGEAEEGHEGQKVPRNVHCAE